MKEDRYVIKQNEDTNNHQEMKFNESELKFKQKIQSLKEQIIKMPKNPDDFKNHQLPLARVKKIMKSDQDVRMISSQTPVIFAKACEIFIIHLTLRAWSFTQQSKRRTLQVLILQKKNDIYSAIDNTQIFDFLVDIIRKEQLKNLEKKMANQQGINNQNKNNFILQMSKQQN